MIRRLVTAAGIYVSVVLGFLGTVVAARTLSKDVFGLFALVLVATNFFQTFFDLTVEEALVKYGYRFSTREDWGRFRRLFEAGLVFKAIGGGVGGGRPPLPPPPPPGAGAD